MEICRGLSEEFDLRFEVRGCLGVVGLNGGRIGVQEKGKKNQRDQIPSHH